MGGEKSSRLSATGGGNVGRLGRGSAGSAGAEWDDGWQHDPEALGLRRLSSALSIVTVWVTLWALASAGARSTRPSGDMHQPWPTISFWKALIQARVVGPQIGAGRGDAIKRVVWQGAEGFKLPFTEAIPRREH